MAKTATKTRANGALVEAVNVGVSPEAREVIVGKLTTLLADQMVLYAKLRKFHWNVTGENFFQLHEAFEDALNGREKKVYIIEPKLIIRESAPGKRTGEREER